MRATVEFGAVVFSSQCTCNTNIKITQKTLSRRKNNHTDAKCLECGFFLLKAAVCNFTTVPITILITYLQR